MNLSRSLKSIVLSAAALGLLFGAPVVTEAALPQRAAAADLTAPPTADGIGCAPTRDLTPKQVRRQARHELDAVTYLDKVGALMDEGGDTTEDMQGLMLAVSADTSLVFDADWQGAMLGCFDNEEAFYHQVQALNPPASLESYHRLILESSRLMTEAGDEMAAFFASYDIDHLTKSSDLIEQASVKLNAATDLLTAGDTGIDL